MLLLQRYNTLLLDMNGTFMFGADRFGPDQDYYATYRLLGGTLLDRQRLLEIMQLACEAILRDYYSPARYEDFPSVEEAFRTYANAPEDELPLLHRLFAAHEIGQVPSPHAAFLRSVASSHWLGVVSNICAKPQPWLHLLRQAGLLPLFRTVVFSSEGRTIKPAAALFRRALDGLPGSATVLFVGDSLERDIIPAKELGLGTVWIAPAGSAHPAADAVIESLPDLGTFAT